MSETEQADIDNFLTTDLECYIENMEKDGTYADHFVLHSLSKSLSRTIKVVNADSPDVVIGDYRNECLVIGYIPEIIHYVSLEPISYEPESFVAVCLQSSRKINHLYIAKVLAADGTDVQLKFMTQKKKNEYTWPNKADIHWQNISDVIMKLSSPELVPGRGLRMLFMQTEIDSCLSKIKK